MIQKIVKLAAASAILASAAVSAQTVMVDTGSNGGVSGVSGVSGGLGIDFQGGNNTAGTSNNNKDTGGLATSLEKAFVGVECKTPGDDC